jgi:hypothetical protein
MRADKLEFSDLIAGQRRSREIIPLYPKALAPAPFF